MINLTDCAKAGASVKEEEFDAFLNSSSVFQGVKVDFPPSKLKSGSGEYVCFVLDRLAEEALRRRGFTFRKYAVCFLLFVRLLLLLLCL